MIQEQEYNKIVSPFSNFENMSLLLTLDKLCRYRAVNYSLHFCEADGLFSIEIHSPAKGEEFVVEDCTLEFILSHAIEKLKQDYQGR